MHGIIITSRVNNIQGILLTLDNILNIKLLSHSAGHTSCNIAKRSHLVMMSYDNKWLAMQYGYSGRGLMNSLGLVEW